jgi:hypothetical protein
MIFFKKMYFTLNDSLKLKENYKCRLAALTYQKTYFFIFLGM